MKKFEIHIYNFMDDLMMTQEKECHNLCSATVVAAGILSMDFDEEQKLSIKRVEINELT